MITSKQEYLKLRYELDQILPDAIIKLTKGRFITSPYYRRILEISYENQWELVGK